MSQDNNVSTNMRDRQIKKVLAGNFDFQVTEDEAEYEDRVVMTDGEGRTRHE